MNLISTKIKYRDTIKKFLLVKNGKDVKKLEIENY